MFSFSSLANNILVYYQGRLEDVTNRITQWHVDSQELVGEDDCNIINSPPAFGAFDLGINRALNEQSPLYQSLRANVKVYF